MYTYVNGALKKKKEKKNEVQQFLDIFLFSFNYRKH